MEKGANSVGGRPAYDGKGEKFSRGGVAGKSEQRQDSNVSLSPQPRAESSYFAISKLIRVLDSFKIKMATSIETKPKTWAETFRITPESTALNKIHGEVVDLFKVTSADQLDENPRQKMFDQAMNLQLDAMLVKSPVDDSLQVLHHSYKLGGDLLNKEEIYFSLFGGGTVAVPVVYKPKSILTIASIDCPGWTTIKAIKTPEDFENAAP